MTVTGSLPTLDAVRAAHLDRLDRIVTENRRAVLDRENAWRERLAELATIESATRRALHIAIHEAIAAGLSTRDVGEAVGKSGEWVRLNRAKFAEAAGA